MIVVRLMGGVGNQMFQYAAARRLSLAKGVELRLDISFHVSNQGPETPRPFLLDRFEIAGKVIDPKELKEFLEAGLPEYRHSINRTAERVTGHRLFRNPRVFVERDKNFEPGVLDLPDDVYLDGYFQSERYFVDVRDVILKEFTVRAPMNPSNADLAKLISESGSVCLHIRRGDYYSNAACRAVHAVDLSDYYRKAIALMRERHGDCRFFIFSDEPEWVRKNFDLQRDGVVVDVNSPDDPEQDLHLMSLCGNFIIANSSFSWWGAWLSKNPDKIVIAPKRWFLDDRNVKDRCPEEWIRI